MGCTHLFIQHLFKHLQYVPGSKVFSFVLALRVSETLSGTHFHKFQWHQTGDLSLLLLSPQSSPTEFHGEFCWYPSVCGISETFPPSVDFKRSESQPGVGLLSNVPFSYFACLSSHICYSFIPQGSLYPLVGNMLLLVFMCVCSITSDSL